MGFCCGYATKTGAILPSSQRPLCIFEPHWTQRGRVTLNISQSYKRTGVSGDRFITLWAASKNNTNVIYAKICNFCMPENWRTFVIFLLKSVFNEKILAACSWKVLVRRYVHKDQIHWRSTWIFACVFYSVDLLRIQALWERTFRWHISSESLIMDFL